MANEGGVYSIVDTGREAAVLLLYCFAKYGLAVTGHAVAQ